MWLWLSRRFRRWVVLAVGVPVLGWTLSRAGEAVERRRGSSRLSDLLQSGGAWVDRERRGSRDVRRRDGR